MRQARGAAVLLVAAMTLSGCGALISSQQEVEIGKGVDQQIEQEYKIAASSDPITKWAKSLVNRLVNGSKSFRDPTEIGGYKVYVIADDELVNAFAAPGGFTYISTGLILQAKNCAEIAGVMGHELGHVTQRHSVKKIEASFAAEQLAALFLGEGLSHDAAVVLWGFLQETKFSQQDEAEADKVGLQIAFKGGYNPYGLVDFFKKIHAMEKKAGGSGPAFLSSHPTTTSRIRNTSNEIERRYGDAVQPGQTQTYECVGSPMTLQQAQAYIKSGKMQIKPGTGGGGGG